MIVNHLEVAFHNRCSNIWATNLNTGELSNQSFFYSSGFISFLKLEIYFFISSLGKNNNNNLGGSTFDLT